jgi:hypothetical protein
MCECVGWCVCLLYMCVFVGVCVCECGLFFSEETFLRQMNVAGMYSACCSSLLRKMNVAELCSNLL